MKVGLCTIALRNKLLEDALNVASEVGFDGVEIWGREPHMSMTYDCARVRAARRMAEERGLAVAVFGSYLRFGGLPGGNETQNVTVEDAVNTTRGLGTKLCRVWAGARGSREASKHYWRQVVDEAAAACETAAQFGITLAVEMHGGTLTDTAKSTLALLKDVGAPNLKANYQCSFGLQSEDPRRRLEAVLPHVVNLHAQNYVAAPNPEERLERVGLADGMVDYGQLVSVLARAGYDGYIEVEFIPEAGGGRSAALRADCDFLRGLCQ